MRNAFDQELALLHQSLIRMGSLVETAIDDAITALKNQDADLANKVFDGDDTIDELESQIERTCLMLLARQQPLARDLRVVSSALKIITDLERIADHAADIAEITLRMAGEQYVKPLADIPKMAAQARLMLHNALDAMVREDVKLAHDVCESDDVVDSYFDKIKFELIHIVKEDAQAVDQVINFLFIIKYLERIGDHATNIAEWVVFNNTGDHRHMQSKHPLSSPRHSGMMEI